MSDSQPIEFDPKLAADIFNRLLSLEAEGHHNDQGFYADRVLWGVLTAMGVCIDMRDIESFSHGFGSLPYEVFRFMEADDLNLLIEQGGGQ